ncbi:DUF3305 domain-containing protein [Palleronia caenipelagi]|uniref:DUF3305 domain-containing protein n=2 Tax=Palleronia caenipelagi TaxID=2489174 RepID=A0A547Q9P9_9RHOB|nr:DUF3305 domain-containing protein [Palleronia caenipelagi]TRD23125.1 DUF3305 domain-containing protein [Palleronia caenipelagi]
MPVGILVRRKPGVTRWATQVWQAVGILPGAGDASWRELRRDGDVIDFHAATLTLELHGADTEAYAMALCETVPSLFCVLRISTPNAAPEPVLVTASPYEAQDYADNGDDIVEKLPMPDSVIAWVRDFIATHHAEEPFVKRRRDRLRTDARQDGLGDPRVAKASDVYASPGLQKARLG